MDGIDYEYHLVGHDPHGVPVFASVDGVRRGKQCVREGGGCGIVEVEIRFVRWVEKQDIQLIEADHEA